MTATKRNDIKRKTIGILLAMALASTSFAGFGTSGAKAAKSGWVYEDGVKTGYTFKNGKKARGWHVIGKALYYFNKSTGKLAKNTTVSNIPIRANGKAKMTIDASIKYRCIKILKAKGVWGKSKAKQLRAGWNWVVKKGSYVLKYPKLKNGKWTWGYSPGDSASQKQLKKKGAKWVKYYTLDFLKTRRGNCYGFACAFAGFADTIGYDTKVVVVRTANSGGRDGAADGYSRHAYVRVKGKVYDPEAANVHWRYVYGAKSIGLSQKSKKTIKFSKVDGSQMANIAYAGAKTTNKLIKKKGRYYYYNSKGKKVRPKNKVIKYKSRYYFFKKYKNRKGLFVVKGKLYNFAHKNKLGYYMTVKECTNYQNLIKEKQKYENLKKLIGEAKSMKVVDESCYAPDIPGHEVVYDYGNVIVNTFVPDRGAETIISVYGK